MKLKSTISLLLCLLIFSSLILSACKKTPSGAGDTSPILDNINLIKISGDYKIIRPDNDSEPLISALQKVANALKERSAVNVSVGTDCIKPGETALEKEILIGNTNREESKTAALGLLHDEFLITVIGEKVVIVGGSDKSTERAAQFFIDNYVFSETLLLKQLRFKYTVNYPVEYIKLNGVDIKKYKIVYPLSEKDIYLEVAHTLNQRLADLCGIILEIVVADKSDTSYEILLGNTNRTESSLVSVTSLTEYGTGIKGSKIMIAAGSIYAANVALNEVMDNYLDKDLTGEVNIELKDYSEISEIVYQADLKILSNNVLASDTAIDRTNLLYNTYMSYNADIIGLQECNKNHYDNLVSKLLLEGYSVTSSTIDNKNNVMSYTPILYKTDKYTLLEKGCFLYDQRYMETDTKTLSYAVFEDKITGQIFAIINTHFAIIISSYPSYLGSNTVEGALWREDNARQVNDTYAYIMRKYEDIPVFAMGDFNCTSTSKAYLDLTANFNDAINTSRIYSTKNTATWHNVGSLPTSPGSPIDHIFISENSAYVLTHKIPLDKDVLDSTDHCPVITEIEFKEEIIKA